MEESVWTMIKLTSSKFSIWKPKIEDILYCKDLYDAVDGAAALALMTEWRQFRMPSWNVVQKVMAGNVVVDGRNIYSREELEGMGFVYTRIGER